MDILGAMLGCLVLLLAISVWYFLARRRAAPTHRARGLVRGLALFNGILVLMAAGFVLVRLVWPSAALAAGTNAQATPSDPYAALAAALAVAGGSIAAGIAVANTGSAAIGTIAEKPEAFGRSLIFVGMAEGIAIYGLIIAFMILQR